MNLSVLERFGIDCPIFQAPIGSVASADLVVAVCNAGAVGNLACTWRPLDQLRQDTRNVRQRVKRAFGANFVLGFPFEERLELVLSEGVPIISFFWGDAREYLPRVKAAGALAVQVVGSISEARRAADIGFDVVVAQGREAGGHVRGTMSTLTLVPQVVDAVSIPVLAAGGIGDHRGVTAALSLGAAGVWVGTRFLAAREANIHPVYRDRLLASSGEDTLYSEVFNVGWPDAPLRSIRNSTTAMWEDAQFPAVGQRPGEGDVVAHRADGSEICRYHYAAPTREISGDVETMALYAGEVVGLVREEQPAQAIVQELMTGFALHACRSATERNESVRSTRYGAVG